MENNRAVWGKNWTKKPFSKTCISLVMVFFKNEQLKNFFLLVYYLLLYRCTGDIRLHFENRVWKLQQHLCGWPNQQICVIWSSLNSEGHKPIICTFSSRCHTLVWPVRWRSVVRDNCYSHRAPLISGVHLLGFVVFHSPLSATLAEPPGLGRAAGGTLQAHAGLINAISLYLLPLNFSFNWGELKQNYKSVGVNLRLAAGLRCLDWASRTHAGRDGSVCWDLWRCEWSRLFCGTVSWCEISVSSLQI